MGGDPYLGDRKSERKRVRIPVILLVGGDDLAHHAVTIDLSPHGARLLSEAPLFEDQAVRVCLPVFPTTSITSRVAWVGRANSPQAGQAGFEFLNLPTRLMHLLPMVQPPV